MILRYGLTIVGLGLLLAGCGPGGSSSREGASSGDSASSSSLSELIPSAATDLSRFWAEPDQRCVLKLRAATEKPPLQLEVEMKGDDLHGQWQRGEAQGKLEGTRQPSQEWRLTLAGQDTRLVLRPQPDGSFEARTDGSQGAFTLRPEGQYWPVAEKVAEGGTLGIAHPTQRLVSADSGCRVEMITPRLERLEASRATQINQALEAAVQADVDAWLAPCGEGRPQARQQPRRLKISFAVNAVFDGLLSLTQVQHRWPEDSLRYRSHLVDLRQGQLLRPEDLWGEGYATQLAPRVEQRLAELYGVDWGLKPGRIPQNWQMEFFPSELMVFFNPYDLGRFQVRRIEVAFTYEEVADLLRPDSSLKGRLQ